VHQPHSRKRRFKAGTGISIQASEISGFPAFFPKTDIGGPLQNLHFPVFDNYKKILQHLGLWETCLRAAYRQARSHDPPVRNYPHTHEFTYLPVRNRTQTGDDTPT